VVAFLLFDKRLAGHMLNAAGLYGAGSDAL
jgi:hypothetical protein